jgi:hypothetical protein
MRLLWSKQKLIGGEAATPEICERLTSKIQNQKQGAYYDSKNH